MWTDAAGRSARSALNFVLGFTGRSNAPFPRIKFLMLKRLRDVPSGVPQAGQNLNMTPGASSGRSAAPQPVGHERRTTSTRNYPLLPHHLSPIRPSVQRALSACGGSAKAQRAGCKAKTPAPVALFLLSGFASLARRTPPPHGAAGAVEFQDLGRQPGAGIKAQKDF